jgi:hypothetical protein
MNPGTQAIDNMAKLVPMATLQNPRVFSKVRRRVEKVALAGVVVCESGAVQSNLGVAGSR